MPCDSKPNLTPVEKLRQALAIKRLGEALAAGAVGVTIGAQGAIAFRNWTDRAGLTDVCAYRRLLASGSPELRRAIARAEVIAGRKVSTQALAAGVHSHDNGATWNEGH